MAREAALAAVRVPTACRPERRGKGHLPRRPRGRISRTADVLFVSTEDSAEIDLKPRLVAAGADTKRCFLIEQHVKLPDDVDEPRRLARDLGKIGLFVIDPVANHIGATRPSDDVEVRHAIAPLNRLADELGCLLIGVRHPGKDRSRGAVASILGSTAWVDTPRAVVMIAVDDEDPLLRHIQVVAGNRSLNGSAQAFRIEAATVEGLTEPITRAVKASANQPRTSTSYSQPPAPQRAKESQPRASTTSSSTPSKPARRPAPTSTNCAPTSSASTPTASTRAASRPECGDRRCKRETFRHPPRGPESGRPRTRPRRHPHPSGAPPERAHDNPTTDSPPRGKKYCASKREQKQECRMPEFFDGSRRWCSRCRQWLDVGEFRPDKNNPTGLHPWCRSCVSAYSREWREANPEAVARYQAQQRAEYAAERGPLERGCVNPECGRTFTPTRRDARTCSKTCRDRMAYLRRKGRCVSAGSRADGSDSSYRDVGIRRVAFLMASATATTAASAAAPRRPSCHEWSKSKPRSLATAKTARATPNVTRNTTTARTTIVSILSRSLWRSG